MLVHIRLGAMYFLQYAILGAWMPVLADDMANMPALRFAEHQIGAIYSLMPLAVLISPMIFGPIADRYVAGQKLMGALHFGAGLAMAFAAMQTEFVPLRNAMAAWALCFAPCLSLANAVAFSHIQDGKRTFGKVRLFGSLGGVISGFALSGIREIGLIAVATDSLWLSSGLGILAGMYCLTLPDTPPRGEGRGMWIAFRAVRLVRDRPGFGMFLLLSLIWAAAGMFLVLTQGPLFTELGVARARLPIWLLLQQTSTVFGMGVLLPLLAPRLKIHHGLALGAIGLAGRNLVYAYAETPSVAAISLVLHGISFPFFVTLGQIFVDAEAPRDLRASAQALWTLINVGVGSLIGVQLASRIWDWQKNAQGATNWEAYFMIPTIACLLCAAGIWFLVRSEQPDAVAEPLSRSG